MAFTNAELDQLRVYFVSKRGDNTIDGHLLPKTTEVFNLGSPTQRYGKVYAQELIADTITGGGASGDAVLWTDTTYTGGVASANMVPRLDGIGQLDHGMFLKALLKDGSRELENHLVTLQNVRIDNIDLDIHDHSGTDGMGTRVTHGNLLAMDADDHPQYTQWGDSEVITGTWRWIPSIDYVPEGNPESYTRGWIFEPELYQFRSLENAFTAKGSPTESSIVLANTTLSKLILGNNDIQIIKDVTGTRLEFGSGSNYIQMSPNNATHRLWIGSETPSSAPFQVEDDGTLRAGFAYFGNPVDGFWELIAPHITKEQILIESEGRIRVGTGSRTMNDYVFMETNGESLLTNYNTEARIWVGNTDPDGAPFSVSHTGQVTMYSGYVGNVLRSTNFSSGISGWSINSTGDAEFRNLLARGRLETIVISERTVSAISGRMLMTEAANLAEDISGTDTEIILDSDIFSTSDIIHIKPDGTREEYMKVVSGPVVNVDGTATYIVTRNINSGTASSYYKGETFVREGTAVQTNPMYPMAAGNEGAAFGAYQPGGAGSDSGGGWLVLDGSKNNGPFFGVIRREGPVYDQVAEVVRIGNLQGITGYEEETYGIYIGDAARNIAYNQGSGLRIRYVSDTFINTTINEDGVSTELFTLPYNDTAVQPTSNIQLNIRSKSADKSLWVYAFGESEKKIMTHDVYDANNDGVVDNALKVNNIEASTTRAANKLLALDASGYFPNDVYPNAVLLDGSRVASSLHATGLIFSYKDTDGQVRLGESPNYGMITIGNPARTTDNFAYIDFMTKSQAGGAAVNYDARIYAGGGTIGSAGQASLYFLASAVYLGSTTGPRSENNDVYNTYSAATFVVGDGLNDIVAGQRVRVAVPFNMTIVRYQLDSITTPSSASVKLEYWNGGAWSTPLNLTGINSYYTHGTLSLSVVKNTSSSNTYLMFTVVTPGGSEQFSLTVWYKKTGEAT